MTRYAPIVAVLAFATGCHGCTKAIAPTRAIVEAMPDPYDTVGARGQLTDEQRTADVIDSVSKSLHYGSIPGEVMHRSAGAPWRKLLVGLLAVGERPQVKFAWSMLSENIVGTPGIPVEAQLRVRYGQAFLWDLQNAKVDDELQKKATLAEIAWVLEGIGSIPLTDGGK